MIDEEANSRPVNSRTGFEGIDVGVQFKSLGALVYYISSPVCAKASFFIRKTLGNGGRGGLYGTPFVAIFNSDNSIFNNNNSIFNNNNSIFNDNTSMFNNKNSIFNNSNSIFNKSNSMFNNNNSIFNDNNSIFNALIQYSMITIQYSMP